VESFFANALIPFIGVSKLEKAFRGKLFRKRTYPVYRGEGRAEQAAFFPRILLTGMPPMADLIPDKAYFRIGEVSKILGVAPYVIRYWETEFKSIRPVRASSDQRLYRRKDIEELMVIKELLYKEKFTIKGARKRLIDIKGQDAPGNELKLLAALKKGLQEIRDIISRDQAG